MMVSVPPAESYLSREQEIEKVQKAMVSILECARVNKFRSVIVPLLDLTLSGAPRQGLSVQEVANLQMEVIVRYFSNNEPTNLRSIKFLSNFDNDNHRVLKQSFLNVLSRCPLMLER